MVAMRIYGLCFWLTQGDDSGKLADHRGMLLREIGELGDMIFQHDPALLAATDSFTALSKLGKKLQREQFSEIRDLGVLRALGDLSLFQLIGHNSWQLRMNRSRAGWMASIAKDLRWLKQLLPAGDRGLVAISHAVLSTVMFNSLAADSDGYVRLESMSSMTQAWWLAQQAQSATVNRICEVGFNGGHSALAMLLSAPKATMISFDLMSKSYTPACHLILRLLFPQRHVLIEGYSNLTIPRFIQQNLHERCDLIFIDGGHLEVDALSDLLYVSFLASKQHLLVMDDVGCASSFCVGPSRAWNAFVAAGRVLQRGCHAEDERRWCWGTYT